MDEVKVIYGSTTGATEAAARQIAAAFGTEPVNIAAAVPEDFQAELLILGTSTWGFGELQDDWITGIELLGSLDLSASRVAVFGLGDQCGFSDTFVDGMGQLAERAVAAGARLVGSTSSAGYRHNASAAERDGNFCGLALDDTNEPEKTPERISAWVEQLKG